MSTSLSLMVERVDGGGYVVIRLLIPDSMSSRLETTNLKEYTFWFEFCDASY